MTSKRLRKFLPKIGLLGLILLLFLGFFGRELPTINAQTVPTRTPSGGGGNGGGGGSSNPTATPVTPAAAPSETPVPVTLAPTPVEGFITPEACGNPIFQASRGEVNVRATPSQSGEIIGALVFLEAQEIVGRSATVTWWRIELADGREGWVSDAAGTVFGNISGLPALDNLGQPVETATWNPTPNPACPTATPTATSRPTTTPQPVTPTPALTASSTPTGEAAAAAAARATANAENDETTTPEATRTATSTTTQTPTATLTPTLEATTIESDALPANPAADGGVNWLLIGGVFLVLAGLIAILWQRLREE